MLVWQVGDASEQIPRQFQVDAMMLRTATVVRVVTANTTHKHVTRTCHPSIVRDVIYDTHILALKYVTH